MSAEPPRKVIRSYRLVFRRRWRIFRIQNWRIPLPGGLELRLLGYWLACLAIIAVLAHMPLVGLPLAAAPASLRLLALPIAAAWLLSRWEVDGRAPHRALAGLLGWRLRPRVLAAGRRCPVAGATFAPLRRLVLAPDLGAAEYPHGQIHGPARVLLRYPVQVEVGGTDWRRRTPAAAKRWRLRRAGNAPLHQGKQLDIPAGRTVTFE
jgi:hypothetical protein